MLVKSDLKTALYFGCKFGECGHYVIKPQMPIPVKRSEGNEHADFLIRHDGLLAPQALKYDPFRGRSVNIHVYTEFDIIAFWDNTVDTRPGANSMFLLVDPREDICRRPRNLMIRAAEAFPGVWARFHTPFTVSEVVQHSATEAEPIKSKGNL